MVISVTLQFFLLLYIDYLATHMYIVLNSIEGRYAENDKPVALLTLRNEKL